jgi:hypothetical protein
MKALRGIVDINDALVLQDVNRVIKWCDCCMMPSNVSRCKVLSVGTNNMRHNYYMELKGKKFEIEKRDQGFR